MSLREDAEQAWDETDPELIERQMDKRQAFITGYLAACKDVAEKLTEGNWSKAYGQHEIRYARPVSGEYTTVYMDATKLAELNMLLERDPNYNT